MKQAPSAKHERRLSQRAVSQSTATHSKAAAAPGNMGAIAGYPTPIPPHEGCLREQRPVGSESADPSRRMNSGRPTHLTASKASAPCSLLRAARNQLRALATHQRRVGRLGGAPGRGGCPPALLAHQAPAARTFVCCCDEPSPSQEPAKPYEAVLPDSGYGWTNPRSARTRPVRRPAKVGVPE